MDFEARFRVTGPRFRVIGICSLLLITLPPLTASGQTIQPPGLSAAPQEATKPAGMTLPAEADPVLQSLQDRVEASELTDEEKTSTLELIAKAAKQQADKVTTEALARQHQAELASLPERVKAIKLQIEAERQPQEPAPQATLPEMETALATLSGSRTTAKQAVSNAEATINQLRQRRAEIDTQLPKLNTALERAESQIASTTSDGTLKVDVILAEQKASAEYLKAQILEKQSEKALLDAEFAANLPQLKVDQLAAEYDRIEKRYEELRKAVEAKRAEDAKQRADKADRQIDKLHPVLQEIGKENQRLATLDQELADKIELAEKQLQASMAVLDKLQEKSEDAIQRVDQVGRTAAVGAMLRNLKQELPNANAYQLRIRRRIADIDDANYDLMDMNDVRNGSLSIQVDALFRGNQQALTSQLRESLGEEARTLLMEQRTEYLDPAIRSQTKYFNTLVKTSLTESEIVELSEKTRRFINENVLWTRSTQPLFTKPLPGSSEWWFTYRSAWSELPTRLVADMKLRPVSWMGALIAILVLILSRKRLRTRISEIGQQAAQAKFTGFLPTLHTLALTIAAAAPMPVLFWFLGERLSSSAGEDRAMIALSVASIIFASSYALLELIRQVCRPLGLAESHLGWPSHTILMMRRNIRLLLYVAVPLLTTSSFFAASAVGYGNDVLERYFFLGALAVMCAFIVRTMHPRRGAPARYLGLHPNGWANRLSSVWYPAMIAIPVLLGGLTVIGYHFTSCELALRFMQSIALLFVIGVIISLAMRWAVIQRRQLRINQLRQQRAQLETDQTKTEGESPVSVAPVSVPEESDEHLREQMKQSRSLFQTMMVACALAGLWLVWSDVVPALDQLEKWPVWKSTTTVTEWSKDDQGNEIATTYEVLDPVTYPDLVLAMVIMVLALAAARNLPGLLEFSVLRRLPLDASIRYAITTLVCYAFVLVGITVAGSTIGLHWNQIQWMATALTFGLAFGLQEMFANFVAGIIILFEQPVRVGDAVQIDGVTGIVTKIRIRATTITDWDRKDYIVPNKEFITGKLLNWTRSDEIVRLTVSVGIAYGSDTKLARKLLIEAAEAHPDILREPPIVATFDRFGDSSLEFNLRVFVISYDRRMHICNDLHMAIDDKFREAGIEISFPQRDLHLRSYPDELAGFLKKPGGQTVDPASGSVSTTTGES